MHFCLVFFFFVRNYVTPAFQAVTRLQLRPQQNCYRNIHSHSFALHGIDSKALRPTLSFHHLESATQRIVLQSALTRTETKWRFDDLRGKKKSLLPSTRLLMGTVQAARNPRARVCGRGRTEIFP